MSKTRREIPRFKQPIIETHCHLDYLKAQSTAQTIAQAMTVGVERFVTISVAPENLETVMTLTRDHPAVWGTQGIHPHEAKHYDSSVEAIIRDHLSDEKICAVGEIGLDYYYDHSDRSAQRAAFEGQLRLAADLAMPVVIHTRDADEDTRAILAEFLPNLAKRGVVHSFTSGLDLAEFCLESGFCLGFNGICTFNKADNVREAVRLASIEAILLETDAPFLTPVPYRGRENAPCFLPFIAEKIAEIKSLPIDDVLTQTHQNSLRVFFPSESSLRC